MARLCGYIPRWPFAPSTVTEWWREHVDGSTVLCKHPVSVLSNWFPISALPDTVKIITLGKQRWKDDPERLPSHRVAKHVVSFASASELGEEGLTEDTVATHAAIECRESKLPSIGVETRVAPSRSLSPRYAKELSSQPSLFPEDNELAQEYLYEVNFHHQLKARLLRDRVVVQIVRETKIAFRDFVDTNGRLKYPLEKQESAIAWNLSTTVFYKAGGRPWKLGAGRDGVCYIGLVFKQDEKAKNWRTACCAAQMFLDSGDGVVFKGAVGPWYRGKRGLFHLDQKAAREVAAMCIRAYADRNDGRPPKQLFIHGQVALDDDEWAGFQGGVGRDTDVVGVRIRPVSSLKLFTAGSHPVPRGLAYLLSDRQAYLWTRGIVPRLRTYPGREVPNPLLVDVCRGEADPEVVLSDVLALTKLNYNACNYADGIPVTLKFARAVGEILTAGPTKRLDVPPLPFKYYI